MTVMMLAAILIRVGMVERIGPFLAQLEIQCGNPLAP